MVALGVAWVGHRRAASQGMMQGIALYTVMAAAAAPLLAWRFDLLPSALGLAGFAFILAGRPAVSGAAIGLGFAAKVFSIVLLPVLGIYLLARGQWGSVGRLLAGFLAAAALAWLPVSIVAPEEMLSFAIRQQERPIQIESIQGGVHLLTHILFGADIRLSFDFGSVNVHPAGAEQAMGFGRIATIGALVGALVLFLLRLGDEVRREGKQSLQTLIDAAVAILLTLLVTNKVLSPQYMIWLLPFAALLRRQHAYLVVLATILTLTIFPLNYDRLIALEPALIVTLNLRNSVLVLLLAMLLIGPFGRAHLARVWSAARLKHPGSPVPPASSDVSRAVVPGSGGAAAGLEKDDLGLFGQ